MTAPPGGGPYDPGQQPNWGGQQGGPQPYPPGGPYGNPQPGTGPYGAGGYPYQQFPQSGQQPPPGWPPGPYSPGPPPKGPGSKTPWLIIAGIAVVGVILLVVIVVIGLNYNKSTPASPVGPGPSGLSSTTGPPTSQPKNSAQTATGCTPNVSGGDQPGGGTISAGELWFPVTAAPGWMVFADDVNPNLIDAVGVGQEVPGADQWMMQAEVAITNFVASMDLAEQASTLMQCVADGPGYAQSSPTLGPMTTSSVTIDGVRAARVDADITIGDAAARKVKGDSVTIIAVDTKPVTIFMAATPIGDADSAAVVDGVIEALRVAS
ncbi:hypothetical protein [Mycobacterium spongiae]|uniref:Membrane glycine and proline rich protein n=1 Tax=Mycobacterium spongiae TaxID=886343 RepID=A0A975JZL1_9MYCO|nr:hypothetical protein [Mycobacterium spongiae]QUR68634.1 hypothetical protein F6B93_17465 [Mycobacterium spongiae]